MRSLFIILVIAFATKLEAKPSPQEIAIFYRYGDQEYRATLKRSGNKVKALVTKPSSISGEKVIDYDSMQYIFKKVSVLKENTLKSECSRNFISFIVKTDANSKAYSSCIGAKNNQAQILGGLFSSLVVDLQGSSK